MCVTFMPISKGVVWKDYEELMSRNLPKNKSNILNYYYVVSLIIIILCGLQYLI